MPKKILVVDDDINSLQQAESILKTAGFEVITMNDPKFIFKTVKSERPDLVVTDIIMPHMDGYALCQELCKLYNDKIPVLLCTAKSYEQDLIEQACKDFGAADFIIKPYNSDEFLKKIEAIFESRREQ